MASIETNDRKRIEMSNHVIRLRTLGWTTAALAVWMDVTPGTVNSWARRASMGTNAQRDHLSELGSPTATIPLIQRAADRLEREAREEADAELKAAARGAKQVADYHAARKSRFRARAAALRKLGGF